MMQSLNFSIFVDKILSGEKTQTIRGYDKRICAGDVFKLKNSLDTGRIVNLGLATVMQTQEITISKHKTIKLMGDTLSRHSSNELARKDGFQNKDELVDFIESHYGLPFVGVIIYWGDTFRINEEL